MMILNIFKITQLKYLMKLKILRHILKEMICIIEIKDLKKCIQYNIKPELLDLIQFNEIGNVRARSLYNNGITNLEDVSDISVEKFIKNR